MNGISNSVYFPISSKGLPAGRGVSSPGALRQENSNSGSDVLAVRADQNDGFVKSANGYLDAKEQVSDVSEKGLANLFGVTGSTMAILAGGAALPIGIAGLLYFGTKTALKASEMMKAERVAKQAEENVLKSRSESQSADIGFILSDGRFAG